MFKSVSSKVNFPKLEEEILEFWQENQIFEKSIKLRPENKTWTFLDGPPFITGLPHYGSLLSSIPKDVFPRYWTMKGYRVRRVWGWDCHGLPAENKVEEKLKIKRKRDIEEKVGVKKFIDECKSYVQNVSHDWEWYVDHIGRWVDFRHAYKTMDLSYMETVMWVFQQMYKKGYVYKGLRISLYCPHCVTPISNFEVAMDADNYKDLTEPTAVFKYELQDQKDTYFLAWSTTPWNKIATMALAVNPKLKYVKVKQGQEKYILAKETMAILKDETYEILEEFEGTKLLEQKFVPHYDFYPIKKDKKAFLVLGGDFVTANEGTGIVTIAAYGEEDLSLMLKENVQIVLHVDEEGIVKKEVPKWAGRYYLDVDPLVVEDLKSRNLIYRVDHYTHSIPTCWRCHTRLLYVPQNAWYVNIAKLKGRMKKTNESVNWFPKHFKYGRYLKSLEMAPDWCISRSRYWGSPVPVWECVCGERFVPGSIAELEKASGVKIKDLHKPLIDEVTVPCQKCGQKAKRVPEVLDSWIEAGSASFAERHYPFNKEIKLEDFFPPDFIVEYTGQIRAWFYVLHVIATALFDSVAFKNVVVTGVILGTDGRKMSKNYGNYPDPKEMLTNFGADALRLYLMGSPVMKGEDIRISAEEYRDQVRGLMLILWNVYSFFISYANLDKWFPVKTKFSVKADNVLDQWILRLLNSLISNLTKDLESYNTVSAVHEIEIFVANLSTWYLRRSRDRVGPAAHEKDDKRAFYETLYEVLVTLAKLMAPLTPFLAEEIYKNLTGEESVHLKDWPSFAQASEGQAPLISNMDLVRKICELGHAERKKLGIKVRQPLGQCQVVDAELPIAGDLQQLIRDELNVKEIVIKVGKGELRVELDSEITPELKAEGEARDFIRQIQELRKEKNCRIDEEITIYAPSWPKEYEAYIKEQTLAKKIVCSEFLKISTG
ncbi:MAG: isoleucine--tRNA ligase [Patescibacteria group bacterium]|nr:isoleucine--tRNA ligase [Patescibacteria group bacterium]MCL5095298.1 isoleucine--tRNA ligase [Patescibacteria group bacterium]